MLLEQGGWSMANTRDVLRQLGSEAAPPAIMGGGSSRRSAACFVLWRLDPNDSSRRDSRHASARTHWHWAFAASLRAPSTTAQAGAAQERCDAPLLERERPRHTEPAVSAVRPRPGRARQWRGPRDPARILGKAGPW